MKEFVAITDDIFYRHPEVYDRLVPFTHDVACRHLLQQPLDIDGYADIIEYSILSDADLAAEGFADKGFVNKGFANSDRERHSCSTH